MHPAFSTVEYPLRTASELAAGVNGLALALNSPTPANATATMDRTANVFVIGASSVSVAVRRRPSLRLVPPRAVPTAGRPQYRATAANAQMRLFKNLASAAWSGAAPCASLLRPHKGGCAYERSSGPRLIAGLAASARRPTRRRGPINLIL